MLDSPIIGVGSLDLTATQFTAKNAFGTDTLRDR